MRCDCESLWPPYLRTLWLEALWVQWALRTPDRAKRHVRHQSECKIMFVTSSMLHYSDPFYHFLAESGSVIISREK